MKVMRHGNCFDGFASAAVFSRFYRERIDPNARFEHVGLRHGQPAAIPATAFSAATHAVVDFRYSPNDRLDWWFDHHRSAFITPEDRAHFDRAGNDHHFWDPTAPSCTGYIARVCEERFGFDPTPLAELVRWADIIDAAQFPDARTAVSLSDPPLQLMAVCEHLRDSKLADFVILGLAQGRLDEVAADSQIQKRFKPIRKRHERTLGLIEALAEIHGDVIFVDMTEQTNIVGNKFGPYYLHPDATYVVVVNRFRDRVKLSVGSNPWRAEARRHDISAICESHGGGGHPVVGGITIPGGTREQGLRIGRQIVETLLTAG